MINDNQMKNTNTKYILPLQILLVLPVILFLVIYDRNYPTIYLISSLVLLAFLFFGMTLGAKYKFLKFPPLLLLIFAYLIYALNSLGTTNIPKTFERFTETGEVALVSFSKPKQVDEICYFLGINKEGKFFLEYQNQTSGLTKWKSLYEVRKGPPPSFQWTCEKLAPIVSIDKARIILNSGEVMFTELRFRNEGENIKFFAEKKKLNDETTIKVSKNYYDGMYFDEIYHGRTAYEILEGIKPIYESTHPYLGKILISAGIKAFGMNPFGWRIVNVIFGTLLIIAAYFFCLLMFKKRVYAFMGGFIATYSFMHLTESRMAMIDTFGVAFAFISYLFLYVFITKQKLRWLIISGIFFGLASAIKWSAVFSVLGFVFIALYLLITKYPLNKRFAGYKLLLYGVLAYGVVAISVYFLTFYEIFLDDAGFKGVIDYQINAFNYHSGLGGASHPYSSKWWSWPFDLKPILFSLDIRGKQFSSVAAFGNPAIFWVGVIAIIYLGFSAFKRKSLEASFILFGFIALYAPYIFVERLMFIYHFYYSLPFVMMAIVYGAKDILNYFPKYSMLVWGYFALVAGLFIGFYPVLSGYEVVKTYVDNVLTWLPNWAL